MRAEKQTLGYIREAVKESESESPSVMSDSFGPHDYSPPGSLSTGFSRQGCWSGLPCPFPGDLPNPGIEPESPELWVDSLPSDPPGKPSYLLPSLINNCLNLPIGTQDLKVMEAE